MTQSTDEIWALLKEDCSILSKNTKSKSITHLWEARSMSRDRTRPGKCFNSKIEKKLIIETPANTSNNSKPDLKEEEENQPNLWSSLAGSLVENDGWTTVVQGDSDDDSDEEAETTSVDSISRRTAKSKIKRLANMLESDNRNERLGIIESLEKDVRSLHQKIDMPIPELDFPPPYNTESIVLTYKQYGATVSDLANGKHVACWQQWQKTKVPLSRQFPDQPCGEGGHSNARNADHSDAKEQLQVILNTCGNALFQRLSDFSEKCRMLSIRCISLFFLSGLDVGKHIPYLMPAIFSRYPETHYDHEMKIFVSDVDSHTFYKRGGAINRQDLENTLSRGGYSYYPREPSEEIRMELCNLLSCTIRSCIHQNVLSRLDPFYSDIILAIQSNLKDPFPKLKVEAAELLARIIRIPTWEQGAKHYATAIARAALPLFRHRNARVRAASINLFEASVGVPDREKIKGAGSEAIIDLVGFREENVLPIAAFYKRECAVTVNSLAEIMIDSNVNVRYRCCQMLSFFICCLPDRYDYQQRILPYLLSFYNDEHQHIREQAILAIENCGQQYEAEHPEDIIERRQMGVDGDSRCNHIDKLPPPFKQRPRLGARLFVRGNTKRFFAALLSELRNWIPKTRHQSAKLLHILVIYCEEHLTMDFHNTFAEIVKAIQACLIAADDDEREFREFRQTLESLLTTIGRYVDPDTYMKLIRLSQGGTTFCIANAIAVRCLISGSLPHRVRSHFFVLLPALSSPTTLGKFAGKEIRSECLTTLVVLFKRIKGLSISGGQTSHFEETGRLCDGHKIMNNFNIAMSDLLTSSNEQVIKDLVKLIQSAVPQDYKA